MREREKKAERNVAEWTAYPGMMLAFALILGYVETLIPMPVGIPGIKLGLANLAVLLTLYQSGIKKALLIDVLRIFLSGFLFGSLYGILYSLAGGLLSFLAMVAAKQGKCFGISGVSMAGGVLHNVGQIVLAAFVVETKGLYYYLPPLLIAGVITGFVNGTLAGQILSRIPGPYYRKKGF